MQGDFACCLENKGTFQSLKSQSKDLYSRKDTNLVFSRFFSRGDVLCYNRAKINSFILKCLENSQEHQPITPMFVLCIVYYTTQNNPWICRYRFNGKVFLIFFCITPHTHRIKKSTVEFHTSKNILKMIKQSNQSRQVEKYLYYHKHDESASIFGMMREGRSLKFKFES